MSSDDITTRPVRAFHLSSLRGHNLISSGESPDEIKIWSRRGQDSEGWISSWMIDRREIKTETPVDIETRIRIESTHGSIFFLLYIPIESAYHGFDIRNGFIYTVTVRPNQNVVRYQDKQDKYDRLLIQASPDIHRQWKRECTRRRFLIYSFHWLWKKECLCHGWDLQDYVRFSSWYYTCQVASTPQLSIRYGQSELKLDQDGWASRWSQVDFEEWQDFCKWRRNYYLSRCRYYVSRPNLSRTKVARYTDGMTFRFHLQDGTIMYYVDEYHVETTTMIPSSHVLTGVGFGDQSKDSCAIFDSMVIRIGSSDCPSVEIVNYPIKSSDGISCSRDESSSDTSRCEPLSGCVTVTSL